MKWLFEQPEEERRATMTGVNLFFGALLGANLGTLNGVSTEDYIKLVVLLGGSVAGLFTIAASRRMKVVWSTLAIYIAFLATILLVPAFRPERMEDEIVKIVSTLGIWLTFLIAVRLTPATKGEAAAPSSALIEDD